MGKAYRHQRTTMKRCIRTLEAEPYRPLLEGRYATKQHARHARLEQLIRCQGREYLVSGNGILITHKNSFPIIKSGRLVFVNANGEEVAEVFRGLITDENRKVFC